MAADSLSASCGDGAAKHHMLNGVSGRRKWRFVSAVSCGPQGDFLNTAASWRSEGGGAGHYTKCVWIVVERKREAERGVLLDRGPFHHHCL